MRRHICACVTVGLLLLAAGCSVPVAKAPFRGTKPAPAGDFIGGTVITGRIYDLEGVLHNYSPDRARLASVHLVAPVGSGIRMLNVRAYPLSQTGGIGDVDEGDLPKNCPELYKPHPVTHVAVAARSSSNWVIVIEVTFSKPGKYLLGLLRIRYLTDGQPGSQDYYLGNLKLTAVTAQEAPPHLWQPTRCTKKVAPQDATFDLYNRKRGFSKNPGGFLYANGDVGSGATFWLGTPSGTYIAESVSGGTWQRSGKTVAICLHLHRVGASRKAPATDTICAHGIPITNAPVMVSDAHGRTALIRVKWIPGAPA